MCSCFLFLPGSILGDCTYLRICPFLVGCSFYWHIAVHSNLLLSLYFSGFSCNFSCFILFFFINLSIYLFLAVLGLRFRARAFPSCGKWGPLFIAVHRPLIIAASLVAEHRLQTRRLSNCGSRAQPLRGMWDLPRPGLEPVPPALAGRLPTTAPPGKPLLFHS